MSADTTRLRWSWADSAWLEVRAFGWMLGVTLPVIVLVGALVAQPGWQALAIAVVWVVLVDGVALLPTAAAAVVALPFTMLLGRLMRPVRSRLLHVVATSALAGTLAAAPLAVFPDAYVVLVPMSVAAGAAGALARRGEFRRADRLAAAAPSSAAVPAS